MANNEHVMFNSIWKEKRFRNIDSWKMRYKTNRKEQEKDTSRMIENGGDTKRVEQSKIDHIDSSMKLIFIWHPDLLP